LSTAGKVHARRIAQFKCETCDELRHHSATTTLSAGASIVPLTPDKPRQAVAACDLDIDYHLNAASFRSRPVHEVHKMIELCCDGDGPGEHALRSLVVAHRLFRASALGVLDGFLHHCIICGDCARRMHMDGNFKAYCYRYASRVKKDPDLQLDAPSATMLDNSVVEQLAVAAAGVPVASATRDCGTTSWKAAAQQSGRGSIGGGGRFKALEATALMLGVCHHRRIHFTVPLWRGETYLTHVASLLMSLLLGAVFVVDDIWCLVYRYLRAQKADFADSIVSALLRPGYTVRFLVPAKGTEGVGPEVTVTITPAAPPQMMPPIGCAVPGGGVPDVPSAPLPPPPSLPVTSTLHTDLLRRFDRMSADVVRGGDVSGAVSFRFRGAIPLCHAKGHSPECQCVYSGAVVPGAGRVAERAEHVNAGISARAPVVRSMRLARYRHTWQEYAATANANLNADAPWALLSGLVQCLVAVTNAARGLEAAREAMGSGTTDDVLHEWAAQAATAVTEAAPRTSAAANADIKLLQLRSSCAALHGGLSAVTDMGTRLLTARGGHVPPAEYLQFITAYFFDLAASTTDLKAVNAKYKIKDVNHAAIVWKRLQVELVAAERAAASRGALTCMTPDDVIIRRFNELRAQAMQAEALQGQLSARSGACARRWAGPYCAAAAIWWMACSQLTVAALCCPLLLL
jgi:hypothetical protein